MAVKLGIWSLTLIPGETYPMAVRKDFQITNAALGEELKDNNGRSVVKVTHEPLPSAFFEASDSEDEYDSEIDGDLPSDEFELDSEEGFKKIRKDKEINGEVSEAAAADEEDDEEDEDFEGDEDDDEEDDEDEDMSDLEDDELLETTVLCALTAGKIEQANLNLTFTEGDVVMFEVTGDNAVHLMGNYLDQFPNEYDSDSDSEFDSEEEDDYEGLGLDEISDEEDEDVPVVARITEVAEPKKVAVKAETKPAVQDKKRKAEVIDSPATKSAAADTSMTSTDGLSKNQKKKLAKKAKTEEAPAAAAPAPKKEAAQKAGKKVLPNGLEIEDVKIGNGPIAKAGKRCQMRYIGKLNNGKQFDANTSGAPFSFMLGRGEVIKGWDLGLNGMAVGGERKLVIPPALAYGKQKLPGLPANSTLNFEVKLLAVK